MDWKPAPSVALLLKEADARWPGRNRASDGIIGDTAHSSRVSDHNPDENGIVHAADLTHDPTHGVDCGRLSSGIVARRDPRLRYVIWNGRICKGLWSDGVMAGRAKPWVWETYLGPNPHDHHMHVSVGYAPIVENDLRPWYGEEDEDVPLSDTDLDKIVNAVRKALITPPGIAQGGSIMSKVADIQGGVDRVEPKVNAIAAEITGTPPVE